MAEPQQLEVPFTDDEEVKDEELITDGPAGAAKTPEAQNREGKKRIRTRELLEQGKQNADKVTALEQQLAEERQRLARLEGAWAQQQQHTRQQQQPQEDPLKAELRALNEEKDALWKQYRLDESQKTLTDAKAKEYAEKADDIDLRKQRVFARAAVAEQMPAVRQESAQNAWVQKYPEVYRNPAAYQYAEARTKMRVAKGEAATAELIDEVMNETKVEFKLGGKAQPSASEKARLSGIPSSGMGGGTGGGSGIVMTRDLKKMAHARWPELSEAEAEKKWVNTAGKQLRADKVL